MKQHKDNSFVDYDQDDQNQEAVYELQRDDHERSPTGSEDGNFQDVGLPPEIDDNPNNYSYNFDTAREMFNEHDLEIIDTTAQAELMPKSLRPSELQEDRFDVMKVEYEKLYSEFI